ncbi:hypothetical protein GCM10010423_12290 [Streptomyces levis]|uniref:Uncharacterized protein n=1 Tax=Streptomyces levis TaxID=285566 RepID=A0ABN3NFX2_9ACTN
MKTRQVPVKTFEESKRFDAAGSGKVGNSPVLHRHLALPSLAPVGAIPSVDASVTAGPACKESLMRHLSRSVLLAAARADVPCCARAGTGFLVSVPERVPNG